MPSTPKPATAIETPPPAPPRRGRGRRPADEVRADVLRTVGELLLTHIPPWTSREDVIGEAKAEFDGPVHAVVSGETFDITRS